MTVTQPSRSQPPALADHPTLAVVLERIAADDSLTLRQRQDMCSALRTLAKALGRRPEEVPAHPTHLRKRLRKFAPAMAGLSAPRWRNVLSLTRLALKQTGLAHVPGRYRAPMTPEWAALFRFLNEPKLRYGLTRLAGYCGAAGVLPDQVNDALLARFLDDLENGGLINRPRSVHQTACRCWNRAVATIAEWPQQILTVPNYRRTYVLPWTMFPPSLKTEADAYLDRLAGKDILAELDFAPLKSGSIDTRKTQLREFISALVHRGHDAETLRSLADIVAVETVKDGLRFYIERPENKAMKHALDIASLLRSIAGHWVKVDPAHLDQLKLICKRLNPKKPGLTDKNRVALRQFDDLANVFALVTLPQRLIAQLSSAKTPYARALRVQTALAIELLLMASPRISNLAAIDLARHLNRSPNGKVVHLVIPGDDVKNGVAIEVALPNQTVQLLDLYLRDHRPALLDGPCDWLFPGRPSDRHKSDQAMRTQIVDAVKDECGLTVTPHQFRHINAKMYLDAHPGAYGVVRLVLGHKSVDTTTTFYCGTETAAAVRHHDEHVLKLRNGPAPVGNRRNAAP